MSIKSGYVAIIGKPNVGKSTLLNSLLGEKLSITTSKPQTTRKKILGILSSADHQIIFMDTPGILKPDYLLQQKMLDFVGRSVKDADVLLFIIDIDADPEGKYTFEDDQVKEILASINRKKILLINKVDLSNEENVKRLMKKFEDDNQFDKIFPISALLNFNMENILVTILEYLPEHPKYYPDDQISDVNERFFVSDIIREKILERYYDEVPYSVEVVIEDFKEREGRKDFIQATILVEKESQKPIIIGKGGNAIKDLGQSARESIEVFLQRPVYLELRVKVKEKWRSDPKSLKSFGYSSDDE
ncbi:MAG: GTPase Era [Ignavibacteriales bacterium]|nr:GTPase Era [Ignavibacteriales bacterium]